MATIQTVVFASYVRQASNVTVPLNQRALVEITAHRVPLRQPVAKTGRTARHGRTIVLLESVSRVAAPVKTVTKTILACSEDRHLALSLLAITHPLVSMLSLSAPVEWTVLMPTRLQNASMAGTLRRVRWPALSA